MDIIFKSSAYNFIVNNKIFFCFCTFKELWVEMLLIQHIVFYAYNIHTTLSYSCEKISLGVRKEYEKEEVEIIAIQATYFVNLLVGPSTFCTAHFREEHQENVDVNCENTFLVLVEQHKV